MKPIIAIIGRPNVGKSTFFNAVTKTRDAIVDDYPGVTRDRHYGDAVWEEKEFTLVDTGGFTGKDDPFSEQVRMQIFQAIDDADVILLLMDGKYGLTPYDREMVDLLRPIKKPVFYVVNKIDGMEQEDRMFEFYTLGLEEIHTLSAAHRYGLNDFLDELVKSFSSAKTDDKPDTIKIAVVGRPNVGKSSLVNTLLGKERHIVSNVPGTTRDAIDSTFSKDGKEYLFIDTAGIRRKGKVSRKIEKFSIIKALRSLDRCDIALVVLDAEQGVTDQDTSIAGYAYERGCGCIFLLNKWDLIPKDDKTIKRYLEDLRMATKFLNFAPAMTISALTGQRVHKIFKEVDEVYHQYTARINTGQLNKFMEDAIRTNEPSLHQGRRIKFYYTTQISTKPPTFVSFVNYPDAVHFSYQRYLLNRLRENTGLTKTPLRLYLRQRKGRKT